MYVVLHFYINTIKTNKLRLIIDPQINVFTRLQPAPKDETVMIVSGRNVYDAFGRVAKAYYPITEALGSKTTFNKAFDNVSPTVTVYDVLDRAMKVTLPDNTETKTEYSTDAGSNTLKTLVTDALGGKQATYTDGSGKTVKTEQLSGPNGTITTSFKYDGIDRLVKVTDTEGNITTSVYDMGDRRTEVNHPASGITTFTYDNLGNVLTKQTANLKKEGKTINYEYDYGRLTAINYPDHPENNVKYHYGGIHSSYNRIGRLMLREDGSGAIEYYYGKMGEVLKTVRTLIVPNQALATYVTQWKYDSHNRLLEMIYPDEEKVTYGYNLGGQVEKVSGYKTTHYDYVSKIGYDKFEQHTYLKYCNGAETFYSYDPERRRLQNLAVNAKAGTIMDNAYSYDAVSNVLSVKNNAPLPQSGKAGGQMSHSYTYDPLYRLSSATGTYKGTDNKTASYTLAMGYDNMHRITSKKQHLTQRNVQFNGSLNTDYDLTYTYNNDEGKKFQLASVHDINYRTVKSSGENEAIYVNYRASRVQYQACLSIAEAQPIITESNSEFSGGNTGTARFSLYVSPYLVAGQGGKYTKHIYVGSQRIVSKLGDLASYGADPRRIPYAGNEADGLTINYKEKYNQQLQSIKDNYKTFDLPYNGQDNTDYVNGKGFSSDDDTPEAAQARAMVKTRAGEAGTNEQLQFYYHPDHLGSSSYITNLDGEVSQHIEYVPFGEVFIDELELTRKSAAAGKANCNNTWNTPHLFNVKELDEEMGMYYYGARYYEPRLSLWMSTDPLQEKYINISSYCYTFDNPIRFFDRNGEEGDVPQILFHNIENAANVLKHGFNASKYGKFSNYNWFSTIPNASGTGRAGKGITIGMKNIDVSNAVKISNRQIRGFYESAKSELGYTSEQLRNSPKLRAEVDRLKFQKLGQWMDANGASAYKVGNIYAVSDAVANRGIATSLCGSPTVIKALNGMKFAGRVLTVTAIAVDMYNIYSSHYSPRVITSVAGGCTGAWVGAKIGAAAGTGVGVWVGGVGEFIGAPLGGLIGGVAGYFTGRTVSETVYDRITQKGIPLGHR